MKFKQNTVLSWPRPVKRLLVVALDVVMSLFATWLAFTLRLDTLHSPEDLQWGVYLLGVVLAVPIFVRFGLYRAIFRYTGQAALFAIVKAVAVYGALLFGLLLWLRWPNVPRSLGVLQPLILMLLVAASRALARFWLSGWGAGSQTLARLLVYGAGAAGAQTAAALDVAGQFQLCGFLDDDVSKVGGSINGVDVFASSQVAALVQRLRITDILLAMPSATRERRSNIVLKLRDLPVHIRTLPGLSDLASGRVTVQDFKEIDIEDLLGRDPVPPSFDLLARNLTNKVVLVSGAGGSIGGELCRQILALKPRQLLLLDHSEFALYNIHQELEALNSAKDLDVGLVPLLGSVTHAERLLEICRAYSPATVLHAAAYKHVPMVESNPAEGIFNNVFGTLNMARAARNCGAANFVLISTDKAVRPTNVMGASKRMAELILQALAADADEGAGATEKTGKERRQVASGSSKFETRFSLVRFGNVLGSSGSVVPLFRRQLAQGGPLTVTHPEVTRYFMTISEAAQLVLQAGAMAQGGEVFVLDMGEPVKIMDLARRMIELSSPSSSLGTSGSSSAALPHALNSSGDIQIAITGLRPGEKLYEELLIGDNPTPTEHPRIMKAHEDFLSWAELEQQLDALQRAAQVGDAAGIKAVLKICVHGYAP